MLRIMRRREFLTLLGGAAAGVSLPPRANAAAKMPRLGVLLYGKPQGDPNLESVRRGLQDLGHVEGQTIAIEYRYAEGRLERLPALAAELVGLNPDVILALGGDVAFPLHAATKTIPIVFIVSSDPVQSGFVASLARPGGNSTGVTLLQDQLASKRLVLLKEIAPRISHVGFLFNPAHVDNERAEAERAAATLGIKLHLAEMRGSDELPRTLDGAAQAGVDALYVVSSRQTVASAAQIGEFATRNRLPMAGGWGAWAQAGALFSYGPDVIDMARQTAGYVDRILKGAKPSELPAQQPTRFELIVNLKTAKALGLAISEAFLVQADKIIE
jgi:putative tryptophan/tyrosine transport system substrate-binding protein